jgi:arylsulfatase A-like enzyme
MEAHRHEPFLAYLSFYSVHVPLSAREDLRQKYERKRNPFGEGDDPIYGFDGETRVRLVQEHAVYAAMVEAMDQAVGKVLDSLEKLNLAKNTVVIFTSDNGGLSTGDRGISTDQGWPTSNVPLRAGKGWLYEGGNRVPLVVRVPGGITEGTSDYIVTSTDFYPTILDLCKVPRDGTQHLDGKSFLKVLAGETLERGPIYWHYPHYSNQGGSPGAAVREGPWKLIHWFEDDGIELYNLTEDIGEKHNLAQTKPEIRDRLKEQLDDWRVEVGAEMPTPHDSAPVAKVP